MKLSIVGCPDKERFRPYVKKAVLFFAEQLISKKMLENIYLRIRFDEKLDEHGYASVEEYNDSGKPREFCIEINPNIGADDILENARIVSNLAEALEGCAWVIGASVRERKLARPILNPRECAQKIRDDITGNVAIP